MNTPKNTDAITQDELAKYKALMQEANIEMDEEALTVFANLLRMNVAPDEIFNIIKEIAPICGILKRFKLKSQKWYYAPDHVDKQISLANIY